MLLPFQPAAAATDAKIINVGAFENYPLIFKDVDGIIKGVYVDVLTEIGKEENINFRYVFGSWTDGLNRIKSGEVDMLTSVARTEERTEFMDYTKNPIMTVWGELYVPEWSRVDSILQVSDKKVGIMTGDINAKNFQELVSKFNISCQFVEFPNYNDVFKAVSENKVDAGIAGITFGNANKNKYGLKSSGVVFNPLDLYFTTAKGKNQDLILVLDKYFSDWRIEKDSFLSQVKERWMNVSLNVDRPTPPVWPYIALGILGFITLVVIIFMILLSLRLKSQSRQLKKINSLVSDKKNNNVKL